MMKTTIMILLFSCILFGCSCSPSGSEVKPSPSSEPTATITPVKEAKDVTGEQTPFGTPVVSLKMQEGKIIEITIDEITDQGSKKELKDSYKMSENAIAPWYKQVEALENYIVQNGIEKIELNEGKVVNEDLMSSVTISVENYIKTINKALNEAK